MRRTKFKYYTFKTLDPSFSVHVFRIVEKSSRLKIWSNSAMAWANYTRWYKFVFAKELAYRKRMWKLISKDEAIKLCPTARII